MVVVAWCDLRRVRVAVEVFWVVFRIPTTAEAWPHGPDVRCLLNCPWHLRGDEIAVGTRQSANMTFSRRIPFQALGKAFEQAAHHMGSRYSLHISHVNMSRYEFRTVHGTHRFTELPIIFWMMMWLYGVPPEESHK